MSEPRSSRQEPDEPTWEDSSIPRDTRESDTQWGDSAAEWADLPEATDPFGIPGDPLLGPPQQAFGHDLWEEQGAFAERDLAPTPRHNTLAPQHTMVTSQQDTPTSQHTIVTPERKKLLPAIAGIVGLCVVVAIVFTAFRIGGSQEETRPNGDPMLSNDFLSGATQYWSIPHDPQYPSRPLAASSTELIMMENIAYEGYPHIGVLSAYGIAGNAPQKIWSVKNTTSMQADFASFWGPYVLYGDMLVDAESGETIVPPWPTYSQAVAVPGLDSVVACASSVCSGYDRNLTKMWSIPFEGTDLALPVSSGDQHFVMTYSSHAEYVNARIINARTGAVTNVDSSLTNTKLESEDAGADTPPMYAGNINAYGKSWLSNVNGNAFEIRTDGTIRQVDPETISFLSISPQGAETARLDFLGGMKLEPAEGDVVGDFDTAACVLSVKGKHISMKGADVPDSASAISCHMVFGFLDISHDGRLLAVGSLDNERHIPEYDFIDMDSGALVWRHPFSGGSLFVARSDLFVTLDDDAVVGWVPAK